MSVQVSERRREQRFSIRLRAQIGIDGRVIDGFEIRDYCSGGMLLVADSDAARSINFPESGDLIEIAAVLGAGASRRRLRMPARVAHRVHNGFGAAFTQPNAAILQEIHAEGQAQYARRLKRELPGGAADGSRDEARISAAVIRVGKAAFERIFRMVLEHLEPPLRERALDSGHASEAQDINKDLGVLGAFDDDEVVTMVRVLINRVLGKDSGDFSSMDPSDLSLLEKDDFESWLIGARMVSRLDDRFGYQMEIIRGALAAGNQDRPLFGGEAPFSPRQIADALTDLADRHHLSRPTRIVLFDTAGAVLDKSLEAVYESLVSSLESIGLHVAGATIRKRPGASMRMVDTGTGTGPGEAQEGALAQLAQLPRDLPPNQRLGVNDLLEALPRGTIPSDIEFDRLLAELLNTARRGSTLLAPAQERTQLVGGLLDQLRGDDAIEPHTADWLRNLHLPLLREALADRGFFRDDQHPLREVVDQVGHLGLFFADLEEARSNESIREALNGIFDHLAELDDGDHEGYQQIAHAIGRLADDESDKFQRNVERVVESCAGRERLLRTRIMVIEELNSRYAGKQIPDVAVEMLEVGWRAQLEMNCLRGEDDDTAYRRDLRLLDDLVAHLGGEAAETRDSLPDALVMHGQIRDLLEASAFDPFRKMRLLDRIHGWLTAGDAGELVVFEPIELPPEARDHINVPEGIDREQWITALEAVEAIEIGETLKLQHDGREQTLRLVWRNEDKTHFTLVDHHGLRAADFKRSELAYRINEQQARLIPVDERPITERAVDNLMADMGRRLNDQVAHDPLTGLQSRRSFQSLLERRACANESEFEPFVLLWMNLDNFRVVNDSASFEAGDALLAEIAGILERQYRSDAVIGYMGGDGFAVLLDGHDRAQGIEQAEITRSLIEGHAFNWSGRKFHVSARIGVLQLTESVPVFTRVMRAADAALVAARQAGGNQVYGYTMEDEAIARHVNSVQWIARVDDALESGRLNLRCQKIIPVVDDGKRGLHYEVLLGVRDAVGEDLNINEFITAAESSNRMPRVDRWIFETAIGWLAGHQHRIDAIGGLAINLSGQTVNDPSFVEFARQLFNSTGVSARHVSFEVTETATIANLNRTSQIINEIKSLGCSVALDDFGSGLASYSYLKELPVDILKIDGVFVKNIVDSAKDLAVVKSINEIGHFMGMETIAEYVVDGDVLQKLREIGVDYAQGFGIEKPRLLEELG